MEAHYQPLDQHQVGTGKQVPMPHTRQRAEQAHHILRAGHPVGDPGVRLHDDRHIILIETLMRFFQAVIHGRNGVFPGLGMIHRRIGKDLFEIFRKGPDKEGSVDYDSFIVLHACVHCSISSP